MTTRAHSAIAWAMALALSQAAVAQPDDNWVIARVLSGRFDELRGLERQSAEGSPVAMYWWGNFLNACVYGRCDEDGARALWARAARTGHGDAKIALMVNARSPEALDAVLREFGVPGSVDEKIAYAGALAALAALPGSGTWNAARGILKQLAAAEPRMGVIYAIGVMEGFGRNGEQLRAIVEAGFPPASEPLRRWLVLSGQGEYQQNFERARSGDIAVAVALCDTVEISEGYEVLPPELLQVCERTLEQGYPGVARTLLRHFRVKGNTQAAAYYAGVCATLGTHCASELSDYYFQRFGKSPDWELWDVLAAFALGMPPSEAGKPEAVMQRVFAVRLRHALGQQACLARRYDAASRKFGDDPACPFRRPVRIPDELRS